jgi:hypothetical protein
VRTPSFSRRTFIAGGSVATAVAALELTSSLATTPARANADTLTPSDIQFDIGNFIAAAQTYEGITYQMPPVHTVFLTAQLKRTPTKADRTELKRALTKLENAYPWGAEGLVTYAAYGVPYFNRLDPDLVASHMPHLLSDPTRYALEEAVPSPKDIVGGNGITKLRYPVPVVIEDNDLLLTLRSDNANFLQDALKWLHGSDYLRGKQTTSPKFHRMMTFTSNRTMFVQQGLTRSMAEQHDLPYQQYIQPDSPMWMGFLDQQTNGAGPPPVVTFQGNATAKLTDAAAGDYFDNGSIQHLSHNILDMLQWFAMSTPDASPGPDSTFDERVQYMFHSPPIAKGYRDQFLNGGGPSMLQNEFRGPQYAVVTAQGIGVSERRCGHLSSLQRSSRAADGTPMHIRMDGPGYDAMDVPDGTKQPKLQFSIFVPTSEFFRQMRVNQAAVDLEQQFAMREEDNGLERFITATRRQNFLVPPRRNRVFPLMEITDGDIDPS